MGSGNQYFLKAPGDSDSPSELNVCFMLDNFSNGKPRPEREMTLPKVTRWLETEPGQGSHGAFVKISKRHPPLGRLISLGTWLGNWSKDWISTSSAALGRGPLCSVRPVCSDPSLRLRLPNTSFHRPGKFLKPFRTGCRETKSGFWTVGSSLTLQTPSTSQGHFCR